MADTAGPLPLLTSGLQCCVLASRVMVAVSPPQSPSPGTIESGGRGFTLCGFVWFSSPEQVRNSAQLTTHQVPYITPNAGVEELMKIPYYEAGAFRLIYVPNARSVLPNNMI